MPVPGPSAAPTPSDDSTMTPIRGSGQAQTRRQSAPMTQAHAPTILAAIDMGSNSFRLEIASCSTANIGASTI
ncbi:hypothetical protein Ddc_20739 [Ditylenchus destructor]|nr:hypothetical protein Ddc_20739 [Ditylenchus destructor]